MAFILNNCKEKMLNQNPESSTQVIFKYGDSGKSPKVLKILKEN